MYCKHCGKEISDDSSFCQYCGGQLQEEKKPKVSVLKRFRSLSRGWQITIMSYVTWFLMWILVLICVDGYDVKVALMYAFTLVVILPVVALFVWYYKTHLRKAKTKVPKYKEKVKRRKRECRNHIETNSNQGNLVNRFPLLDFAQQHGKMQVKTVANPTTNDVRSYCVFINEQGTETKVEFGESLGVLRPQEISERKEQLEVVQRLDGTFELVEK